MHSASALVEESAQTEGGFSFVYDDGGRVSAGAQDVARDCGIRAVAVATGRSYADVRDEVHEYITHRRRGPKTNESVSDRIRQSTLKHVLGRDWRWISGATQFHRRVLRFRTSDIPTDRVVIVFIEDHFCAVREGVIHDVFDPTEDSPRVRGYFEPVASAPTP